MLVLVRRNELEVKYTKTSRVFAKCTDSVLLGPGRGFYLLFVTSWLSERVNSLLIQSTNSYFVLTASKLCWQAGICM